MNKIVLEQTVVDKLKELTEGAAICDESGAVVGFFRPVFDKSMYEGVDSSVPTDELLRRAETGCGRTWSEIKADLEKQA